MRWWEYVLMPVGGGLILVLCGVMGGISLGVAWRVATWIGGR